MGSFSHLQAALARLETQGLLRFRGPAEPNSAALVFCSNDYLGYASTALWQTSVADCLPSGATASRLVCGTHPSHDALEQELTRWLGFEDALVFSSGYAANVGLLSSLLEPGDLVVSDARNHASTIDGCRLAKVRPVVVPHRDVNAVRRALEARAVDGKHRRWILTESYFSMDADLADVAALRALADEHDALLIVDESHALGVFGPEGRGVCAQQGIHPDAVVGTFGKAVGGQGAFVAGPAVLMRWLWNRARSFVFSTGMSPVLASLNLQGVKRARGDDKGRQRLTALAADFRSELAQLGFHVNPDSCGPIVPVFVGDSWAAVAVSEALLACGIRVSAIRPPTVPEQHALLRVTLHARLPVSHVEQVLQAFQQVSPRARPDLWAFHPE